MQAKKNKKLWSFLKISCSAIIKCSVNVVLKQTEKENYVFFNVHQSWNINTVVISKDWNNKTLNPINIPPASLPARGRNTAWTGCQYSSINNTNQLYFWIFTVCRVVEQSKKLTAHSWSACWGQTNLIFPGNLRWAAHSGVSNGFCLGSEEPSQEEPSPAGVFFPFFLALSYLSETSLINFCASVESSAWPADRSWS